MSVSVEDDSDGGESKSKNMCVNDEENSEGGKGDSEDNKDYSEDDEDDSKNDSENNEGDSESDEDGSKGDSEGECVDGKSDTDDNSEDENSPALPPLSDSRSPWIAQFHPPFTQQFQSSTKCSDVLPSSPIQTFRKLFSDDVFNLIHEQTNIYGKANRKGIPPEIVRYTEMGRDDVKFLAKNSISVVKWTDRKPIYMMSHFSDPSDMITIT
ncbi:unnamed protein product, partial [Rotaria sordida]